MFSFIGQALLTIGLAGAVFIVIPIAIYTLVGACMAAIVAGLMVSVEAEHLEITLGYMLTTIGIGLLLGMFWPALPIIVVWGGVKRRRVASQTTPASKDNPSSPSDPPSP